MSTLENARQKAANTYNAASDYFDHPANTFWERYGDGRSSFSVREVRPDLHKVFNPVNSPEDWWAMVLGSGYRGTIEQLSFEDRERVRLANFDFIRQA